MVDIDPSYMHHNLFVEYLLLNIFFYEKGRTLMTRIEQINTDIKLIRYNPFNQCHQCSIKK